MKVRLIIISVIVALAFPAIALAANPKTGPITNYSFTCAGPSFDYHNLPAGTRIWERYTIGHQPWSLILEQLKMLSGSGTFVDAVPTAVEGPATVLDLQVSVPSKGITLDRSQPGGCAAPPPPKPVVIYAPPTVVTVTQPAPPTPRSHHPMRHHKHHKRHHHRRHHRRRRHHKLRICKLPGGSGHICGTPVRKSGNG